MDVLGSETARAALLPLLAVALAVASATDLASRRIPNRLSLTAAVGAGALLAAGPPALAAAHLACGCGAGAMLGLPALLRPQGMGMGDAKLAGVIGLCLGPWAFAAVALGCLAACTAGLSRVLAAGGSLRGLALPFAPFLALGCLASQMLQ